MTEEAGLTPREIRRRRREELKKKSTGTGLKILIDDKPKKKKINFDDIADEDEAPSVNEKQSKEEPERPDEDESDDESAIEEVKTSAAKELIEQEQAREEKTAAVLAVVDKKRKRKRKIKLDEMDEDFFAQVDAEIEKQEHEIERKPAPKLGKHTTFVVSNDEQNEPVKKEHNIDVVVLRDESNPTLPVSSLAKKYSRRFIKDGADVLSQKQIQKAKRAGQKDAQRPHWKRSKKMNHIFSSSSKQRKEGTAAPQFVVKM